MSESDQVGFIKGLYHRTNNCINETTSLMNYHLLMSVENSPVTYADTFLLKSINDFQQFFDHKLRSNCQKILSSATLLPQEKVKALLEHVRLYNFQSFIFLMRSIRTATVVDKLSIMDSVSDLLKGCPDISLTDTEKLCYTRLSLVRILGHYLHQQTSLDGPTFTMLQERIIDLSTELCERDYDHPEPYFFLVLLTWPFFEEKENKFMVSHGPRL